MKKLDTSIIDIAKKISRKEKRKVFEEKKIEGNKELHKLFDDIFDSKK